MRINDIENCQDGCAPYGSDIRLNGRVQIEPNCTSSARAKATGRESLSSCAAAALQTSSLSSRLTGKFGIFPFDSKGRFSIYFCSTTRL